MTIGGKGDLSACRKFSSKLVLSELTENTLAHNREHVTLSSGREVGRFPHKVWSLGMLSSEAMSSRIMTYNGLDDVCEIVCHCDNQ